MTKPTDFYKLAQPSGWDFYTGKTINYRDNIGKVVYPPTPDATLGLCSNGVIHASRKPNDCFQGAKIPCSAYRVRGIPVVQDDSKAGFLALEVLEEITDLNTLFGWRYSEAVNFKSPFLGKPKTPTKEDTLLLTQWDSVWASVRDSVWDSVWASVRDSVWASVWASGWDSVWASVWDSVRDSVWASVWASVWESVWANIGWLFAPAIPAWRESYPYQSAVGLWQRGFVPVYDGNKWQLLSGEKAKVVYSA